MNKSFYFIPLLVMTGCAKKTSQPVTLPDDYEIVERVQPIGSRPLGMVLKATAFKMTGDYFNNVAVTLNPDGSLAYYPAPSDITPESRPLSLGNGWWLNRQGLGPNSQFTKYTFDEYEKLTETPSQEQIKAAIIPGARVSEFKNLSYPAGDVMKYLPEIKEELK